MNTQSVAILGGSGFVGRHLACRLVALGHRVTIVSRKPRRHRALSVLPTARIIGTHDFCVDALSRELSGCTVVINLIGILNERGHRGRGFEFAHVELTKRAVQVARAIGARHLLQLSALGADSNAQSHYLRTKGLALDWLAEQQTERLTITAFCPSIIFGPGDGFFNRFKQLLAIAPGVLLLPGYDNCYAPIYVNDVVSVMIQSLGQKAALGQVIPLCGPKVYTLYDLVTFCAHGLDNQTMILGLGDFLSRSLARVLEYVPGKPYSYDNYLSGKVPSVCEPAVPSWFTDPLSTIETIVPGYLKVAGRNQQLIDIRKRINDVQR